MLRKLMLLAAVCLTLFTTAGGVNAQTATGQITGTIRYSTGAVLPQAKVTVSSQATGLTRDTITAESGDYSFTLLPVGTYTVSAEVKGFSKAEQSNVRLNVDQVQRIDLTLSVGSTTE